MKIFFKGAWIAACIVLAIVFLISAFSQFIPPSAFDYMVFIALLFPYLFLLVVIAALISLFINKKLALFLLLLLIPGLYNFFHVIAISPTGGWKMEKEPAATRIMTWNVSDFISAAPLSSPNGAERKQILQTISQYNPDILCLQEYTNVDSSRDLASVKKELDSIGYKYIHFSKDQVMRTFYGIVERGVAICSKTPFLDTGHLPIRTDWHPENMVYADVMMNNKRLRISTAHLYSFYLFPDSAKGYVGEKKVAKKLYTYKRDIQWKMRDIEVMHQEQATSIRKFINNSPYPVVYCGDMNATSTTYSYHVLKGNHQDAFLQKGNGIGATFYNIVPTLRIDMCFPDKALKVEQCTVIKRKLGDHYPVVTDVKWRE